MRLRHGQAAHDATQKVLCEGSGRVIGVAQRLQGAARGAREQAHHAALAGRKVQLAGNVGALHLAGEQLILRSDKLLKSQYLLKYVT